MLIYKRERASEVVADRLQCERALIVVVRLASRRIADRPAVEEIPECLAHPAVDPTEADAESIAPVAAGERTFGRHEAGKEGRDVLSSR
jgi:hypothetical protein